MSAKNWMDSPPSEKLWRFMMEDPGARRLVEKYAAENGGSPAPTRPTPPGYPPTPNLDKMKAAKDQYGTEFIGSFIEWLGENDMAVCELSPSGCGEDNEYFPIRGGIEKLLARYVGVDLDACEREKSAILDWQRDQK